MTEVVSSTLGPIVQKLGSSAFEEIQLVWGVKDDREKLKNTLETIQKVLADAEQKQTKEAAVEHWLLKLKNFCYDAEDVVDEFETRALWRRARSTEHLALKRKVRYLSSWPSNFIFQFKMAHKMKKLRTRLDEIYEEIAKLNLLSDVQDKTMVPLRETKFNLLSDVQDKTMVPQRETHSFEPPSNVIGRNEEKERIIELLIRSDDGGAGMMGVVPIVGMGGAGKTTLAKLVYNDDKVNDHFKDNKIWLYMPVEFELKKIIGNILESLDQKEKYDSLEMMQKCLRSTIANKRYLFVMDDVWQASKEDWEKLRDLLGGVSEGSKVILTSRNESIASIMGTVAPLKLAELSQEDSLTLLVKYAFNPGQEKNHPDLMKIGKEIVSKCRGNPMAVKTLGSLLYSKYNRSYWEYVRDSEMWELETDILPSVRISYDLMPSYLKRCFAICSIFPKNHEFTDWELIQLWISSGFIQSSGNNQELEEIGRRYLEELRSRSFFDFVDNAFPFQSFEMHDLIYELAISVAQTESSNMKVWTQDISSMTRHISFPNPSRVPKDELSRCLSKLSRVRTIICEGLGSSDSEEFFLETCISRFKHLRVLWLPDSSFDILPSSIGGLKHLRFLSLRENYNIKKLPESVCKLRNLQYLNLGLCEGLEELPADIKNMISLRILFITSKQQRFPERGIGCLTSLRWLLIVGCENLEALFDDIQSLASLRKLFIVACPKLASLPQGIKNMKALEDLFIDDCESLKLPEGESNDEPPSMSRLRSFVIGELPEIVSLPGRLEGSASTLQSIKIEDCPKLRILPEWLQNCSSLRTVEIKNCRRLSILPDSIRRIATIINEELSSDEEEEEASVSFAEDSDEIYEHPNIFL